MTKVWYIDAVDARAGLAFASCRSADLGNDQPDTDILAVHIAAPDFRVETVASRAIALAATRGSFQLGFFIEDDELAFGSLGDVVEFVRRIYAAGGGGDGDGGVGGGVPPLPDLPFEGGGTLEPEEPDPAIDPLREMVEVFKKAAKTASNTNRSAEYSKKVEGGSKPVNTAEVSYNYPDSTTDPGNACAGAVVSLAEELFRRCPTSTNDDLATWWESVRRLGAAAGRLGLCRTLVNGGLGDRLADAGNRLFDRRGHMLFDKALWTGLPNGKEYLRDRGLLIALELLRGLGLEDPYGFIVHPGGQFDWEWYFSMHHFFWKGNVELGDRFDDLSRWPIPDFFSQTSHYTSRASVADFLCEVTGAPTAMALGAQGLEILLFSVMHLECDRSPVAVDTKFGSSVTKAWRIALSNRAKLWLNRQMPRRAFSEDVEEKVFNMAAKVRYG